MIIYVYFGVYLRPQFCLHLCFFLFFVENLLSITRTEFFEEWLKNKKEDRNHQLFLHISSKCNIEGLVDSSKREMQQNISAFSSKIAAKWYSSGSSKERFLRTNESWLNGNFNFRLVAVEPQPQPCCSSTPAGRPQKKFEDSSFRTKKRRVEDLVRSRTIDELCTAAEVAVRSSGQRNVANTIKDARESPNSSNSSIHKHTCEANARKLTSDEALAYYIDAKSTTHAYKQTRKWSIKTGHNIFPSYNCLKTSKNACYPSEEKILITETRAEIKLQAILDKTAQRLVQAQEEVIKTIPDSCFTLISKWGCDGSSGHSNYKQKFQNTEDTDEFLFIFSFVPLQLVNGSNIIWQNPRPSSTMYCRPIKFIFAKETPELTLSETDKIFDEINNLLPSICNFNSAEVSVTHELMLTMVDGKVCNALTETHSSQKCYICGATPKMMNDEVRNFHSGENNYSFGLSTLHAWIRCFECLLHISYKLEIKKWQGRSAEDKAMIKERSDRIKQRFKNEMGLNVDKVKPGSGSSNDGNTARRFFENPELTAAITGLDVSLIMKLGILLRALSSGFEINLIEFNKLCFEIRRLYLSLYPWYYMPATLHKILVHSTEIIENALVPIGQLSEEAQEARNKDCRRFREHNTRKISRITTNRDLLNMMIVTSDPLINSLREIPKKPAAKMSPDVLRLLKAPNVTPQTLRPSISPNNNEDYDVSDSEEDSDEEFL